MKKPNPSIFFAITINNLSAWSILGLIIWIVLVLWGYSGPERVPYYSLNSWLLFYPPIWQIKLKALLLHLLHLSELVLLAIMLTGLGRGVIRRVLGISGLNQFETLSFGYAAGMGLAGCAVFLLGMVGGMRPFLMWGLLIFFSLWAVYLNRDFIVKSAAAEVSRRLPWFEGWGIPIAIMLTLLFVSFGFYALAPETFWDSLVYHLALPGLYKMEGRIVSTPHNMYSGIPMLSEMLYAWALCLDDEILAKLLHWSAGIGLVLGMVGLGVRCRKPILGLLAALIFFSTPLVGDNIMRSAVEVATTYWIFAGVYALSLYFYLDSTGEGQKNLLVLSAAYFGFSMASKYTNWPVLAVMVICLLVFRLPFKDIARFVGIAAVCVLPWIVKNLWFYGNPLFPYFNDFFSPNSPFPVDWRALHTDGWGRDWAQILGSGRALFEVLAHPWFITVRGSTDFDHVGPLYLLLLPGLLWLRSSSRDGRIVILAVLGLWLSWWPLTGMPRFFMPGLALLSLLMAAFVIEQKTAWIRHGLMALVLLLCLNNMTVYLQFASRFENWPNLLEGQPKSDYLRRSKLTYISPAYSAIEWINQNASADSRVLFVGDGRAYYLNRRFIAPSVWDAPYFFTLLDKSATAEELKSRLSSEGITHLVVNMALLTRTHPPKDTDGLRAGLLAEFIAKHAVLEFEDRDLADARWNLVYRIVDEKPGKAAADYFAVWYSKKQS